MSLKEHWQKRRWYVVWQKRRWYVVVMAVNGGNVGWQSGIVIGSLVRRQWASVTWELWSLCVAAFVLYGVRYTEEWRVRIFMNIAGQREAIERDLEIKTKILGAMNASDRVEVRVFAAPGDKETRH